MTLTPEYQYLGRSAALKSQNGSHSYYLLLYGASSGLAESGSHHVSIKLRLACAEASSFYGFSTSGAASVGGQSAFSWSWGLVPNAPWNTGTLTEGGITYTAWTDLREGYAIISTGYGVDKTVDLSGSFTFCDGTSGYLPQKNQQVAVSVSCVLPAVAGLGKPSCAASGYLGSALSITVSGYTGMTHALRYRFGSAEGSISGSTWTPPLELAHQIPNADFGTATIYCDTYSGGTYIGTEQTTVTLLLPESVLPTVDDPTYKDTSNASSAVGCLVQNVSALAVTPSAGGIYGSTIVTTSVLLDGKAYNGGVLTASGSHTLTVTATDSRGRTGKADKTITVAAYKAPTMTLSASRCTADGTADEAGGYAKITVTGSVTSVGSGNPAALTLYWGSSSESVSTASISKIVEADVNATMSIRATLSDKLITTERSMTLSTGYATLDLLAGGKGIAFGKAATREGFDCAMRAYFPGGISDIGGGVYVPNSAVNDVFNGGFYRWDVAKEQTPFANATMLVVPRAKDTSATQIAFCNSATYKNTIAFRTATTSDPGEWMFFNPYLSLGNEYLTIERWKGKSVYKKLISFGTLPASGEKNVNTSIAFADYEIVGYSIGLKHNTGNYVYFMTPNLVFGFYKKAVSGVDYWHATAEAHSDLSAYTVTVEISYVKKG